MVDERKNPNGSREDRHIEKLKIYQAMFRDIRYTIPLVITLVGALGYTNAEEIKRVFAYEPLPIAEGETVIPEAITPELKQSLDSMDAAIAKLQARVAALAEESETEDETNFILLDERLKDIEAVVQN